MAKKQTKTTKREYKKHFVLYNNGGIISATTPKDWARAHQELFNGFDFSNSENTPTVDEIENYLVVSENFSRIENNEIIILYPYLKL
jgi:hypothetical protein